MARCNHSVPLIPQKGDTTCWFACIRMLAKFAQNKGNPLAMWFIENMLVGQEASLPKLSSTSEVYDIGRGCGLRVGFSEPGKYFYQEVDAGPVIWIGKVRGYRGYSSGVGGVNHHAVVIHGYDGDYSTDYLVNIKDPFEKYIGATLSIPFSELKSKLPFSAIMRF